MDLFVVLSELEGTGVPLSYLLVGINAGDEPSKAANSGAMTCMLQQFLPPLKMKGLNPSFFGCDKDRSEIVAIRHTWPNTTIQLCYLHAKRAVRNRLRDNKKTKSQSHYYPDEAKKLVPALEICWEFHSVRRTGDHRYGR